MFELTALELSTAISSKQIGVEEALSAYFKSIETEDGKYNSFLSLSKEAALTKAREIQKRIDAGERISPLAGVPIAIKDNISTKDIETTCASKALSGYVPVYNATVVDKLEEAGMIVVGKLNMDEFAMGGSSETGYMGPVRNPWDSYRVAGGSSGGSAAAIAAGMVPLALGTDTGGSIRQPCSFCGTTGIKPTYGAVSRYGLIAYASSLDQIGPMGKNLEDCATLLSIISGPDEKDGTCIIEKPFEFEQSDSNSLDGMIIGIPKNYYEGGIDNSVKTSVLAAARKLEEAGARLEEFEMPLMEYMIPTYYVIACAEASSNLSRFDGLKYGHYTSDSDELSDFYRNSRSEGFGMEIKRRIMLGSFVLSSGYYDAYYKKALQARRLIKDAYDSLFQRYDMIISPVAPTTAYKIGENIDDPLKMYMGDIYTVSINLAGLPAVSLPCGFDENKLPIGFQLIGKAFSEPTLVKAGKTYQLINN
ncbi:MAG: Asp-tRNA(Asn)/Glu-tRNA(Gln) amidotransferase subunit GatA [Oscillospiraceae bacterium]|nr:Asp-tRNA(Asn)/Glu-tRNA(Gln) amidotransferase subunit GatA [Oscillospiraceae bacterium]